MKYSSDLQENAEVHQYFFDVYELSECFVFTEKRKFSFPSVKTRKGIQYLILYKNSTAIFTQTTADVLEAASVRKKLIFKFLKERLGNLKEFQCKLKFQCVLK